MASVQFADPPVTSGDDAHGSGTGGRGSRSRLASSGPGAEEAAGGETGFGKSLFDFEEVAGDSGSDEEGNNPFAAAAEGSTLRKFPKQRERPQQYRFTENVAKRAEKKEATENAASRGRAPVRINEPLNELVAKKREMFLLEYSLRVKHDEIARLEETATARALEYDREEARLKEESASFDRHLKENNLKTMEAMRNADAVTKTKLGKAAEAKRLQNEISALQADIAHFDDQLAECQKYKEFLDTLRLEVEHKAVEGPGEGEEEPGEKEGQEVEDHASLDYFKDPHTLLNVFKALEEQNMFLIENAQETERVLEAVKQKRKNLQLETDREIQELNEQIRNLKNQIAREKARSSERSSKSRGGGGAGGGDSTRAITTSWKPQSSTELTDLDSEPGTQLLADLRVRVEGVYERCIGPNVADLSPLQMLAKLEKHLRDITARLERLPPEKIAAAERLKEKERRIQVAKTAQLRATEARNGRSKKPAVSGNTGPHVHKTSPIARARGTEPALGGLALTRDQRRRNQLERQAAEAADEEYFFGTAGFPA